jgi:glycosidase
MNRMRWKTHALLLALGLATTGQLATAAAPKPQPGSVYDQRERDWRNGAVVYQVIVDRFAPAKDLAAKRALYPAPKRLRDWGEVPAAGTYLPEYKVNSAELDFWGGDLASTTAHLGHVRRLGAQVLYLNPIHLGWTNHKYDALDYQAISPEYGNRDDFRHLAAEAHRLGMKVVLDGVFNHMGRNAPAFQQAMADANSRYRPWFAIGPQYEGGARVWTGFQNHPELNLDHPPVRRHLWLDRDSVVRSYLRDGADGWRLDTAFELGPRYLRELTDAAHREKPGSLVIGEIANYPGEWLKGQDGVMNFTLREILLDMARGTTTAPAASRMIDRLIGDAGIEPMLKSWTLLDNHDVPRIATQVPDEAPRRMLQALQFTLPGSPNLYYGAEVGMTGGADPANRGPMRWDLVADQHPETVWLRKLIDLRAQHRALRVGDFRRIDAEQLLAFERHTDKALESLVIIANPSRQTVRERLLVPNPWLMDGTPLRDVLGAAPVGFGINHGLLSVELPPQSVLVLQPQPQPMGGYSRYKNVR